MRCLILTAIIFSAAAVSFGQYGQTPKLPPDQLALRDRLESMSSIVRLHCGGMMPVAPGEMYADEAKRQQAENNKYRLEFFRNVKAGRSAKLSYICGADEGGTISYYFLFMDGRLTHIVDYSRDPFGGAGLIKKECTDLTLAHHVKNTAGEIIVEFLNESELKGKVLWLSCATKEGRVNF